VYIFNIEERKWRLQMTKGEPPRGRAGHAATLLPSGKHLMIYAGYKYLKLPDYMSDAFVLDLETWEWIRVPLLLHQNSADDTDIPTVPMQHVEPPRSFSLAKERDEDDFADESDDEYDRCAVDIALAGHSAHLCGDQFFVFGGETAIFSETKYNGQFSSRELYRMYLRTHSTAKTCFLVSKS
jgi:hypothetical protein